MGAAAAGKKKGPVGRPRVSQAVTVRLGLQQLASVDEWRQGQLDQPGRSEAIRRLLLVAFTLKAMTKGRGPKQP